MSRTTAVRISCTGEAANFVKRYQQYNILADHEIFTTGELSQVSALLGIPLLLMKLRPSLLETRARPTPTRPLKASPMYGYTQEGHFYPNEVAMYLMGGNPETAHDWSARCGSVLIARQDGLPLHTAHISILVDFLNFAYQYAQKEGTPAPFQPHIFKDFFDNAVQKIVQRDPENELAGLPSPF